MIELLSTYLGQGVLGQVIKHIVPWEGVNKFIPAINVVEGIAVNKFVHNLDWGTSAVYGVVGALGAKGTKDGLSNSFEKLQDASFPGFARKDGKFLLVKRAF